MMAFKLILTNALILLVLVPGTVLADLTPSERQLLDQLDADRTASMIRHISEGIVRNRSGAGSGTAVAGSQDEQALADAIEQELKGLGISVRQEPFPVRHYEYGEVLLTASGNPVSAVSLHAAGGTWGTFDGVPYARGTESNGHRVRANLVDVGEGFVADYARAGDVRGKVVLVRRGRGWPTYILLEAAHRGAAAILMYDYPGSRDDALKQDSMWYHEKLPTVAITKRDAIRLQEDLEAGPVEIVLENRIDVADGFSQNVVGTIPGTERPDEWIIVSAHYDRWFEGSHDNSSGVAVMLELARVLAADYRPERSLMFVGTGAEEAGIEATESDWLAGSLAFIRAHPDVLRRAAYIFYVDRAGWTAEHGTLAATADTLAFQREVLTDLGLADRVAVRTGVSSNVDAWNYGAVGGGAVGHLTWGDRVGGRGTFTQYYHTQLDRFRPDDYANLFDHLRVGLLSVLRMDQAVTLPVRLSEVASWADQALAADSDRISEVSFEASRAAVQAFQQKAEQIETARASITNSTLATLSNRWLMKVRKDLVPWLLARGRAGFRTSAYTSALVDLGAARAVAENGETAATIAVLEEMRDVAASTRVSPDVFQEQRLYWYSSGDWSVEFEQKTRPIRLELVEVYRRLKAGGAAAAEAGRLRQLEARGHLENALFLVTGKLNAATRALDKTPGAGR